MIALTQGKAAVIDQDDIHLIDRWEWYFGNGYAVRGIRRVWLHHVIWEGHNGPMPDGLVIDHRNNTRLDNRLENLRLCTEAENARNKLPHKNSLTGLKGVIFEAGRNLPFRASIMLDGKRIHLGSFATAEEAHAKYAAEARKYHGDFARVE